MRCAMLSAAPSRSLSDQAVAPPYLNVSCTSLDMRPGMSLSCVKKREEICPFMLSEKMPSMPASSRRSAEPRPFSSLPIPSAIPER